MNRGYTDEQIRGIFSEDFVRVFEQAARDMRGETAAPQHRLPSVPVRREDALMATKERA